MQMPMPVIKRSELAKYLPGIISEFYEHSRDKEVICRYYYHYAPNLDLHGDIMLDSSKIEIEANAKEDIDEPGKVRYIEQLTDQWMHNILGHPFIDRFYSIYIYDDYHVLADYKITD